MARSWAVLDEEMIAQTCSSSVPIWPVDSKVGQYKCCAWKLVDGKITHPL